MPRRIAISIAALTCLSLVPAGAATAATPSPSPSGSTTTTAISDAVATQTDGVLRLTVADDFDANRSHTTAFVQTDAGNVTVPTALVESLSSGDQVTVDRDAAGKVVAVDAAPGAVTDATALNGAISGVGTHNIWYVRVNWSDGTAAPTTSVDTLLANLTSYYSTISASRIKVVSKGSLGTVTVPKPAFTAATSCGATTVYDQVITSLATKVPASRLNHLALILPDLPDTAECQWWGLGSINAGSDGRAHIWFNGAKALTPRVLDHEFGHNLGLQHSDYIDGCSLTAAKQVLATSCYEEYGDPWDVMGGGSYTPDENTVGFMSAPNLDRIGLLSSADKYTVAAASTPTVRITPVSSGAGRRLVTVPYGTRTFTVEYRYGVPGTLDGWLTAAGYSGAVVRLRDDAVQHDLVIGYTAAGGTLTLSGLSIKIANLTSTGADVTVTRTADKTAPTLGTYGYWNSERTYDHVGTVLTSSTLAVGFLSVGDADSTVASTTLYVDGKAKASVAGALGATQLQATGLAQGAHKWHFVVRDIFGNARTTPDASFRIDTGGKPKITTSPRASLAKGTVSTKTIPATVAWSATDGCGIVWNSVAGTNGLSKTFYGKPKALSTRVKVGKNQFAARVADCRYNTTGISKGPKTTATLDKQSKRKGYHGTWTATKAKKALGGTEQVTKKKKAYVTYKVKARSIGWVATKGKDRGKAAVYVDGKKVAVVNLSAKKTTYAQQVFTKTWSKAGTHTIKIVNLSSKKVGVDAFTRLS